MKTIKLNNYTGIVIKTDAIVAAHESDLSGMPLLVLNIMGLMGSDEFRLGYRDVETRDKDLATVIAVMEGRA